MRVRLLALSHIKDGADRTQTAKYLKVSSKAVNNWARKFLNDSIQGLMVETRSGRGSKFTTTQLSEFEEDI